MAYLYENVFIKRVKDADTFVGEIDFGFSIKGTFVFRLKGVDAPETWRPSCEAELIDGEKATKFVKELIEGKYVKLKSYKLSIYGRYECDIWINDKNLADLLTVNNLLKKSSYPPDPPK